MVTAKSSLLLCVLIRIVYTCDPSLNSNDCSTFFGKKRDVLFQHRLVCSRAQSRCGIHFRQHVAIGISSSRYILRMSLNPCSYLALPLPLPFPSVIYVLILKKPCEYNYLYKLASFRLFPPCIKALYPQALLRIRIVLYVVYVIIF